MPTQKTEITFLTKTFANSHRKLSSLHRERELLPYFETSIAEKKLATPERGFWTNVAEHCYVTALVTDTLSEALQLDPDTRTMVNAAAWIHDTGKKVERFWQQLVAEQVAANQTAKPLPNSDLINRLAQEQLISLQLLSRLDKWEYERLGVKKDILHISEANIPTYDQFQNGHATIAERIMWFADACVSNTEIVPIPERFVKLLQDAKNGAQNRIFSDSYTERFQGQSLYDVQVTIGKKYAQEFAQLIGIDPEEIFIWLQQQVQEKIQLHWFPEINGRIIFNRKVKRT